MEIIRDRKLVRDSWKLLKGDLEWLRRPGEDGLLANFPAGDIIVPLSLWESRSDDLLAHPGRIGVWLDSDEQPERIFSHLARFQLVAVNFPQFTDGRGYSIARLLRERLGYKGELRAIGDVLRDQIYYLSRCGFDAFALRADQNAEAALAAFDDFSEAYQTSVERPQPLFRRRLAAARAENQPLRQDFDALSRQVVEQAQQQLQAA